MHNKNTKYHTKVASELRKLRKGSGITLEKTENLVILREITALSMGVDSHGITNSQVYKLLLTEISKLPHTHYYIALRFALSLTEETKNVGTLAARRQLLARSLDKHVDTVIRYENKAINALASILESLKAPASMPDVSAEHPGRLEYGRMHGIMRDTAELNLSGLLPLGNYAAELVGYLEKSQRPLLDTTVDIKFSPSRRGNNWYRLAVKYTFTGVRSTFRLAVVVDSEDGEQLMMNGLIDEFHKLNHQIDPTKEIRSIINNSHFIAYHPHHGGQKLFRFYELEQDQIDFLLQSAGKPLKAHCRFIEVTIPREWQAEGIIYEYKSALDLRDDIHYAYWYAPSMMYLKKLIFDYSGFPNVKDWNFVVMPFLGNVAGESVRNTHSLTVHPNSWIMPGHGIALIWEVTS